MGQPVSGGWLLDVIGWGVTLLLAVSGWVIGLLLVVSGWVVGYFLTVRAHQKRLHAQLINDARLEVARAIRVYESWLMGVGSQQMRLKWNIDAIKKARRRVDWPETIREARTALHNVEAETKWAELLEEFEILFPETAEFRKCLLDRHELLGRQIFGLSLAIESMMLGSSELPQLETAVAKFDSETAQELLNQLGLVTDLRIHLQNRALSAVTGNRVSPRIPEDPSLPRMATDESGNLVIVPEAPASKS